MKIDPIYCMSAFLALRFIPREDVCWKDGYTPRYRRFDFKNDIPISSASDIDCALTETMECVNGKKLGILLSGGMDSAILATYLPPGTPAYTLRSIAGQYQVDEADKAKIYADLNKLNLRIVSVTWDDYEKSLPVLFKRKNTPVHSIEPLLYKACQQAAEDGVECLLCGESADVRFGGLDSLLSRDYSLNSFHERYCCVPVSTVLNEYSFEYQDSFRAYDNGISPFDTQSFLEEFFYMEGINSYLNSSACTALPVFTMPYSRLRMTQRLDLVRIRNGENKYLVRELFAKKYPGMIPFKKTPMVRAVDIWLKDWAGPTRPEFKPECAAKLNGDQRWLVYCLEKFLNFIHL